MSSTSIEHQNSPTNTMLDDANEHHSYNQQNINYQQQHHHQQQQPPRHYHQYTTKAIIVNTSSGSNGNSLAHHHPQPRQYQLEHQQQHQLQQPNQQHKNQQHQSNNTSLNNWQMNKESTASTSSNSSTVSVNGSQDCSTSAAVHIYNNITAHDATSQSTQYYNQKSSQQPIKSNQQQSNQYQSQAQQQQHYIHNTARTSAAFPNTSNVYAATNGGANGTDVAGHLSFPANLQQKHPNASHSLSNTNTNVGCANNITSNPYHHHHQQEQYQNNQQINDHFEQHQYQIHQQQQQQQQHHPQYQLQQTPNVNHQRLSQQIHNTVDVCCIGYNGSNAHVERVAAEVTYCSSSTSSCCSSSSSVAAAVGVGGQINNAVCSVTPVIQHKLSRAIPSDKINLRLILVSGKTKEFLFNPTDSAGDIAQTVFDNWPEDWEREAVSKAEILRLIYQGRFLHCNVTLGALGLPMGKTTVMHLVPRDNLPEPNSQDQRQKSKSGSSRCCSTTCCIL